MEKNGSSRWAEILKTIGHPVRIGIMEVLLGGDRNVSAIWGALGLAQSTVSQHLSVLRTKGIVQGERRGSQVRYSITDRKVEEIVRLIKDGRS
jgi:ArsR family transcriptional regulator